MNFAKIFLVLTIVSLLSCNNKKTSKPSYTAYDVHLIDSLKMNGTNLRFDDYRQGKILFHNPISNAIYIFDLHKKTTYKFNQSGSNFDNYPFLINNVSFFNDTTIAVGIFRHINLYNLKGKFVKEIQVKRLRKTYAPIENIMPVNDSALVYMESIQGNTADPNLYKTQVKTAVHYNFVDNTYKAFADFPEKESDYNNKQYYYILPALFTFRKQNDKLYTLSYNDAHIYQYNIQTGQKENVYNLKLKYYKPYKKKYGNNSENMQQAVKENLLNSTIYNFDVKDSLFYIAYNKAFDKKELTPDLLTLKSMPEHTNCLQVVGKNGKVIYDNKIKHLGRFMFEDNNYLYFEAPTNENAEQSNYTIIYKTKLIKNDN